MSNSQGIKTVQHIASMQQLASSMLVAEVIIELREERKKQIETLAADSLPPLNVQNKELTKLYEEFCEAIGYKNNFVYLAKIGLEELIHRKFQNDPSVVTSASADTQHLQSKFGANYSILAQTNLLQHTVNVFKIAIENGKKKGRIGQFSIPILGALFHDFGKSTKIREELMGEVANQARAYKAHADVSSTYVKEILSKKFFELTGGEANETIEKIAFAVLNHHPSNNKLKNDSIIKFILEADGDARSLEFKTLSAKKG